MHAPVDNVEVFRSWKALGYVAAKVNTFARYTHDDDRVLLLRDSCFFDTEPDTRNPFLQCPFMPYCISNKSKIVGTTQSALGVTQDACTQRSRCMHSARWRKAHMCAATAQMSESLLFKKCAYPGLGRWRRIVRRIPWWQLGGSSLHRILLDCSWPSPRPTFL